ncbi:DUF4232 domain-containing protein [Streptomyces sp. CA-181903]|uniref:DUF4232 domain-containing protein n=1 Tax=Streptomyces sp. CA-181903 TaxID=3240055 RepID=UPI003D8FBF57
MRVQKLTFAVLAVAASLSLTACQNDDGGSGQNGSSSASSASSAKGGDAGSGGSDQGGSGQSGGKGSSGKGSGGQGSTGKGSGEKGTTAGGGSGGDSTFAKCRAGDLAITAKDNTIDGDPGGTVAVTLKNRGDHSCAISGYAGVDLKTTAGSLSAKRTGEQTPHVVLKSGQSTAFGINYPINKTGGSGVRITGLLVTPPSETTTVTLRWPGGATLPVTDETTSAVKVGPVGNIGQGS